MDTGATRTALTPSTRSRMMRGPDWERRETSKSLKKTLPVAAQGVALIVALTTLALWLPDSGATQVKAQQPITIGFDMNTAGNSCPGPGSDCTLGAIDRCVSAPRGGGVITIDVFLKDLPQLPGQPAEGGITSFAYHIGEKNDLTVGTVTAITHQNKVVNLLMVLPNASPQEFSDRVGTSIPTWYAVFVDLRTAAAEFNPPFTKGVLSRLEIDTAGTADGVYGLALGGQPEDDYIAINDVGPDNYCNPTSRNYVGCDVLDAYDSYGLIAVGVACPSGSVGGTAELPDVPDSPSRNRIAPAALAAAGLLALTASAWYARRRWLS